MSSTPAGVGGVTGFTFILLSIPAARKALSCLFWGLSGSIFRGGELAPDTSVG